MRTRDACRFTLIELLVVVAIIAILAALLLPVLARARYQAKSTACLANHRQVVLGLTTYADDADQWFPFRHWQLSQYEPTYWSDHTLSVWDMSGIVTQYLGTHHLLFCAVTGVDEKQWPLVPPNHYQCSIHVFGGFCSANSTATTLVAPLVEADLPKRLSYTGASPITGDRLRDYRPQTGGWYSPHAYDAPTRIAKGPGLPLTPTPYGFVDGSVRLLTNYSPLLDIAAGTWGREYWALGQ